MRSILRSLFLAAALTGGSGVAFCQTASLTPAQMIRSLEFVQDAVVQGDHSAIEMQRHLIGLIDERLRGADSEIFSSAANVDAAMIYAMSGGNPQTLAILASRDSADRFDDRLVSILGRYLAGEGHLVGDELVALLPEYRGDRIEPYLTLVAANLTAGRDPDRALRLFDWVRLLSPGTILEEAALRRSIFVATRADLIDAGLIHAERYARRFLHSPYAGQFADLFVELVLKHPDAIEAEQIVGILGFMDIERQRSVYLRIARKAAISGDRELAMLAAARAEELASDNPKAAALAELYAGAAGVPSENVVEAAERLSGIDDTALSERDRALQRAARIIAEEVVRRPDTAALTSAVEEEPTVDPSVIAAEAGEPVAQAPDPVEDYVNSQRAILDGIDALLEEDR
jgi:chemotaxis protein MotC